MTNYLLANSAAGVQSMIVMVVYIIAIVAFMYLMIIRPQKKQQKQIDLMISELEVGDVVLTTSGFYGTIIADDDDVVIVEFGNNKNCRIPMQKSAIMDVEKKDEGISNS